MNAFDGRRTPLGPGVVVLLLTCLTTASAQPSKRWASQLPPSNYFVPDIDTTSPTPLPRVPPSPYALPADNCPQQNGIPYAVGGYPGTPYLQTPFTTTYAQPVKAVPSITVCRTGDPQPQHCMKGYEIEIAATSVRPWDSAIPACQAQPATQALAYNGHVPGPTITSSVGHETFVRFTNNINSPSPSLPNGEPPCIPPNNRAGRPISVHLHGSASLAPFDGWAEDETCGGETKDYIYPNNRAATEWYHDHALHITLENAYHGLAGMYVSSDKIKDGACGEPYNLEDIEERVMILQDKVLTRTCQFYYDYFGPHNRNLYGDINVINGIPWPEMPMEPKWYRFRFLNAAVSRPWLVKLKDDLGTDVGPQICKVIASDGGYRTFPVPFPREGLQIGVAERYEVVCNFAPYAGRQMYLWNGNNDAMFKDVPYFCYSHLLALITVAPTVTGPAPAFDELLLPPSPLLIDNVLSNADLAEARRLIAANQPTRNFVFGRRNGQWVINGETWDTAKIAASDVGQNTWELWRLDTGGGWFHPIHVHLVDFFVMQRGNNAGTDGLFAFERDTPKDVVFLGPSQTIWLIARFGPHRGSYMFHCHNLDHEDHDMMRAYTVVGGAAGGEQPPLPVANPATTLQPITTVSGVIYNNFAYNDPRTAQASARPTATWPAFTPAFLQTQVDQNLYRIFYAQATDIPGLLPPANPWFSPTCQSLPTIPAPAPAPAVPAPAVPAPAVPAPAVPTPAVPAPAVPGNKGDQKSKSKDRKAANQKPLKMDLDAPYETTNYWP